MKQIIIILLTVAVTIVMSSCGGGGSSDPADSNTTEPNTNQYDLRKFIDTASYRVEGTGIARFFRVSYHLTGIYQSTYNGTSIVSTGETVYDHNITLTLDIGEEIPEPWYKTAYFKDITMIPSVVDGQDIQSANISTYMGHLIYVELNQGRTCKTTFEFNEIAPVPTDARVGYISDEVPLICNDGTYVINVMELNDTGGGNAELSIISKTYVSEDERLLESLTTNIVLTQTMSMLNVEISIRIFLEEGFIEDYTLYSTSITQN